MSKLHIIDEEEFRNLFLSKSQQHIDRAICVLNNFGPRFSYDVTNAMMHATDKGKEEEVLTILEKHWGNDLQFQHPDIRGVAESVLGENKTTRMFLAICRGTLALEPAALAA